MTQLLHGEDTYSIAQETKKLKAEFTGEVEELAAVDLPDAEFRNRFQDALQSQGLFAAKKLVIVRDLLGRIKDFLKSEGYLGNVIASGSPRSNLKGSPHPSQNLGVRDDNVMVVFTQMEKFDRRLKFFKTLQKSAEVREFTVPCGQDLENWIRDYLNDQGYRIEASALAELMRLLGQNEEERMYDLWQVSGELEKLMLYTPHPPPPPRLRRAGSPLPQGEREITAAAVRELVKPNISQNIFQLTNLFAEGKSSEAAALLETLAGRGAAADLKTQAIQIIGGLASQIRSMFLVKSLEGQTPAKIAQQLGWKEGRVWINSKLARRFTKEKLAGLLKDLRALDLRLKTSEEPPKLLLTLFLLKARP